MKQKYQKSLGYALSQVTRVWNQRFMDILRSKGYYNLKPSFCAVFFPLFENDGQSASELARATKMTKQTIGIYVRELHQRGYIKLVNDARDKRVRRIFLTAKGSMLQKIFESTNLTLSKEICGHLHTNESLQLSMLLEKCLASNKK
ncbi:MAG: helix-turn-helix domain-containing protein [Candidatus Moranbacteria bacterium]|nr:helix-turn-helix domain-containing protein [Candidatus Moranbacteria bacterium]